MSSTRSLSAPLFLIIAGAFYAQQALAAQNMFLRKVSMHEVEADLEATLATLLKGGSAAATRRMETIEKRTWHTFQALPKNAMGRLAPPAVRYIVHDYFAREHGWLINGLEPNGMQMNVSQMHDINILLDKAPLVVESLLEARQADRGLSFNDIVTMAAVLEQMMFDESVTLLQAAYRLNGLSTQDQIGEDMLHKVLQSYLSLFGSGSKANLEDAEYHQALVASQRAELEEFECDTVGNYKFARRHLTNPFGAQSYSFQAVSEIMEDLAQHYGKWQNEECRLMKAHLVELDPEGSGHVPLGLFYGQPKGSVYHFSESADYLRQIGALDETSASTPKVIIPNYLTGPSNCIATSSYYSVCCLSDCAETLGDIEHAVAAPSASPQKLLALVGNISDKPLPRGLPEKLEAIAARHDGEVPLHGRLFAQWLHFAFPHECPFPALVQSSNALTANHWLEGQSVASAEEREHHMASPSAGLAPSAEDMHFEGRWSDEEVLPVHEPVAASFVTGAGVLRVVVQMVAVCVALRSAFAAFHGLKRPSDKASKSKKGDDLALGFSV